MSDSETISVPGGARWTLQPEQASLLSRPNTKRGRLQRAALALLFDWNEAGEIPAAIRFAFYALEQLGVVSKAVLERADGKKGRRPDQDLSEAFTHLRDHGIIPWGWVRDDRRSLSVWRYAATVAAYLSDSINDARIDVWGGEPPPIILCESAAVAGVLEQLAAAYLCPISGLSGMTNGFLRTVVAPQILDDTNDVPWRQRILYLGDWDFSGGQIEQSTRRILEEACADDLDWQRVGLTEDQVDQYDLRRLVIHKTDKRHARRGCCPHPAVEAEALGQTTIRRIIEDRLADIVPTDINEVLEREQDERVEARELLGITEF